jgi:hypothetical protein
MLIALRRVLEGTTTYTQLELVSALWKRNEIRVRSKCPGQDIERIRLKKKASEPAPQYSLVFTRSTHGLDGSISAKATTFKVHY